MAIDTDAAIAELDRLFSEAWHRTDFTVYTTGGHKIAVTILDAGPAGARNRYCVKATTEDGRKASGNAAESISTALSIVHWSEIGLKWSSDHPILQAISEAED